ncbi:Nramp family divalent metal transporter [Rubrobacter calidifluminis]|uniref:Nramp family divalent metal transporter n=1 Tax=Rubrobacter calidifluminis TaxID=1392640 RepID=UPI0023622B08|nr:Nramp family divalent metal transporter [Rubrobacter calidifluminis]
MPADSDEGASAANYREGRLHSQAHRVEGTPEAPAGEVRGTEERYWDPGRGEPMPIRRLPEAPVALHLFGPAMVLVALGVGLGETFMWPRLVIIFGPQIRWLFLIGVSLQAVVMLEMARYAMATGESIFFGAARIAKPFMWFFFAVAILVYIWPGHVSLGAQAFEYMTGIGWLGTAIVGIIIMGVIYTVAKYVYSILEAVLSVLIGLLVIGSVIVAGIVGTWHQLWATLYGLVSFGYMPKAAMSAAWFPVIVGSIAFAGPSGMQQMWYTLWLRDKGAGMGAHIPRIKGLIHLDEEEETMPSRGFMFDTEDRDEMRKWRDWRRWVSFDAILLFWGITMLVTIVFTILAQAAGQINPHVIGVIKGGDETAAISAIAAAYKSAGGTVLKLVYLGFIAIVGWKGTFGIFDAFARGQSDMTYYFIPGARRFSMNKLYFGFLYGVMAFGILVLLFGPADGPASVLDILAFLSTFAMGAYCILLLFTNNLLLPKRIRPNMIVNVILAAGAIFYLGMLFYSLFRFGVVVG